uniref:lipoyl(octanoyl) transferase n=1 Tax=Auxenochlorella protothecoides TaxID=3075 RepID=A0A1D2A604_AUXPR
MSAAVARGLLQVRLLLSTFTPYSRGLELQDALAEAVARRATPDQLLLVQHAPVYTIGKRGSSRDFRSTPDQIRDLGAIIHSSPRGGEVTFHGPGQLVAYPIVHLRDRQLGARAYVESLEDALIDSLREYGIKARGRVPGGTGVWVGDRKIAAVGVRISRGVASHGIALNVCTDLSWFRHIVPCGFRDKGVTSIAAELGQANVGVEEAAAVFTEALGRRLLYGTLESVGEAIPAVVGAI